MIFKKYKSLLTTGLVLIIAGLLLWPDFETASNTGYPDEKAQAQGLSAIEIINVQPAQSFKKTKRVDPVEPIKQQTVEEGMKHEMQRVADIYEQRSKYAPYSLFLSDQQTDLIQPNQSHESPRAYDIDGESVSILIKPRNYRFSLTEKISAHIQIESSAEGLKSLSQLDVGLKALESGASWKMNIVSDTHQLGTRVFVAEFDPAGEVSKFKEQDYSIIVKASFNHQPPVLQSAPIKIVESIAQVTGLGSSLIENNDLVIPVHIQADKSGYYQLTASLFDSKSNLAVSYLIAKEALSQGSNTMNLKVQGLVLRDKGFSGPFNLQGISLVKKSERPGMMQEYGQAAERYAIEAVNLDDFESIPYEDPMAEQRLQFMRSIGQ